MKLLVLAALIATALSPALPTAAALGGAAQLQAGAAAPACFAAHDVLSAHPAVSGGHTAYFKLRDGDVYRIETSDNCLGTSSLASHVRLGVAHAGGKVCSRADIFIGGVSCRIASLTKLTPQQAAALPSTLRNEQP